MAVNVSRSQRRAPRFSICVCICRQKCKPNAARVATFALVNPAWPHSRALLKPESRVRLQALTPRVRCDLPMLSTDKLQIALSVTPLLIGYVRNVSPNYDNVESLLLGGSTTTLILCLLLGCINSNRRGSRGHLNAPTFATIQSPSSAAVRVRRWAVATFSCSVLGAGC